MQINSIVRAPICVLFVLHTHLEVLGSHMVSALIDENALSKHHKSMYARAEQSSAGALIR